MNEYLYSAAIVDFMNVGGSPGVIVLDKRYAVPFDTDRSNIPCELSHIRIHPVLKKTVLRI